MKLWFFRLRSIISPDTMSKCKKALRKVRDCQSKNKAHHLNLVQQLLHLESQSVNIKNSSGLANQARKGPHHSSWTKWLQDQAWIKSAAAKLKPIDWSLLSDSKGGNDGNGGAV